MHVGEWKTAYEEMSRDKMSAEQRGAITDILRERFDQCVDLTAAHRNVARENVIAGFDSIFLEPQQAKELGLIDDARRVD